MKTNGFKAVSYVVPTSGKKSNALRCGGLERLSNNIAEHMATHGNEKYLSEKTSKKREIHIATLGVPTARARSEIVQYPLVSECYKFTNDFQSGILQKRSHLTTVEFVFIKVPSVFPLAKSG